MGKCDTSYPAGLACPHSLDHPQSHQDAAAEVGDRLVPTYCLVKIRTRLPLGWPSSFIKCCMKIRVLPDNS